VTWLRYRTAYYNDTFQVLRRLVGSEALIMSRPVDYDLDYSPRDVVFMGWVGDEEGTYDGLQTALRYMLESGRRHYVGFGSDIGGYRTDPNAGPLGRTKELFLRWTAIGALSSFMENGGNGEHLPWNFDAETVDIYRSWVNLHYSLIPYLFTEGTKAALAGNNTLMRPCDDVETLFTQTYFLGPKIYVVPVLRDPSPNQTQRLWLPISATDKWIYAFNTSQTHRARSFIHEDTSRLDRIPMYVQQSSLIPMYDLERSQSLDTFKFILCGEALFDKQSTSLFTRDGQEWRLEFDRIQRRLTTHFVRMHSSSHDKQQQPSIWFWRFCQYAQGEQMCSKIWSQLSEGTWSELEILV
jgi:alpha-glucosidase (family GH31 glycosyl hydrolase)